MHLLSELDAFDGKHTDVLESLLRRLRPDAGLIDELCSITEEAEPPLQTAATWVMKRLCDSGLEFTPAQAARVLELVGEVPHWESSVHLLQVVTSLTIPPQRAGALRRTLIPLLDDPSKLVRAWAWGGLIELADQHEDFRSDVKTRVLSAKEEAPASVKARIRNSIKGKDWLVSNG